MGGWSPNIQSVPIWLKFYTLIKQDSRFEKYQKFGPNMDGCSKNNGWSQNDDDANSDDDDAKSDDDDAKSDDDDAKSDNDDGRSWQRLWVMNHESWIIYILLWVYSLIV